MDHTSSLRRFGSVRRRDPSELKYLSSDHPAVVEGRPLFPTRVVKVTDSPRLLVSGHNNRKIGKRVLKGEWTGMPIYTLTLAERSSCPRHCFMFQKCYGDAMHFARRHEHGSELERRLVEEVAAKAQEHRAGFVVRLHVLGDFYSAPYVGHWHQLLDQHKELHIWGYTARNQEHDLAIVQALTALNQSHPDRCFIRFSSSKMVAGGATVLLSAPRQKDPMVVLCPAEQHQSECCASCGLCWSKSAREKTIAFIEHGGVKKR